MSSKLAEDLGQPIREHPDVARDHGVGSPETVRNGVKQTRRDAGLETGPTNEELAEIRRLRKEVADHAAHDRDPCLATLASASPSAADRTVA